MSGLTQQFDFSGFFEDLASQTQESAVSVVPNFLDYEHRATGEHVASHKVDGVEFYIVPKAASLMIDVIRVLDLRVESITMKMARDYGLDIVNERAALDAGIRHVFGIEVLKTAREREAGRLAPVLSGGSKVAASRIKRLGDSGVVSPTVSKLLSILAEASEDYLGTMHNFDLINNATISQLDIALRDWRASGCPVSPEHDGGS